MKMIITIKDGQISSQIENIKGKSCTETDKFLKNIGVQIKEVKTKDYYLTSNKEVNKNRILQK